MAVWIWRAMSGNGVPIGLGTIIIKKVHKKIPRVLKWAPTALYAAAAGSMLCPTAGPRAASTTFPATAAMMWAFAC